MSEETLKKAEKRRAEQAAEGDQAAAAEFTEEIVTWLNEQWEARGFTFQQRVFSLALATVNFREHVPETLPNDEPAGKDEFDRVCQEARRYYDVNVTD